MPHTFRGQQHTFHFNSDGSGELEIVGGPIGFEEGDRRIVYLDLEDVIAFVAHWARLNNIARLERASDSPSRTP